MTCYIALNEIFPAREIQACQAIGKEDERVRGAFDVRLSPRCCGERFNDLREGYLGHPSQQTIWVAKHIRGHSAWIENDGGETMLPVPPMQFTGENDLGELAVAIRLQ